MKILTVKTTSATIFVTQRNSDFLVRRKAVDKRTSIYYTDSRDSAFIKAAEYAGYNSCEEEYRLACLKG